MSQSAEKTNTAPASPCVGICKLDRSNVCIGCGRLLSEIAAWSRMTSGEQRNVYELAAQRLKQNR
ncbi:MAG TPA: DUF1289 domain-containing protein [Steroidobacter sp.]|uniref:DUF1289 domain-containing protein n=1 Tax=Steroidobacter sp. TaxID=1978227 RepID=UPI002ED8896C